MLHTSRGPTTTPTTNTTAAAKTISSCTSQSRQTLLALRNCAKCVQQVFLSDLASCENVKHPVLLLETLLLALISLADCPYGRRLLGPDTFQKFLVPFTTSFPLVSIPRSAFDTYPDSITFSIGALILLLRSWPGIFYFLSAEGQQCLCTLTQSLTTGSSKLRLRILCLLYSLLPGLPFPHLPTASGAQQFPLQRRKFQQQYQLDVSRLVQTLRRTALSNATPPEPFPNLDGDFVVDEGCRLFGRPRYRLAGASGLVSAAGDANPLASAAAAQILGFLAYKVPPFLLLFLKPRHAVFA
ncbi:unnamed protein product [Dibothriocephalus latus]|uniref:Rapamycin-insensitive companion of mTOR N-terminal domain-containing protein n=1 Tax=Dibothriocephalus latus TaxID=60516 RepID=A0A3P7LNG9_DIBLA|nr:unnamed protein product [Dibothriocephalus latus]